MYYIPKNAEMIGFRFDIEHGKNGLKRRPKVKSTTALAEGLVLSPTHGPQLSVTLLRGDLTPSSVLHEHHIRMIYRQTGVQTIH